MSEISAFSLAVAPHKSGQRVESCGRGAHRFRSGAASFALRVDSEAAQFSAIRTRLGIGIFQFEVAQRYPQIKRALAGAFHLPQPLWIVMHENLRRTANCRALFDALGQGLTKLGV
jgi:DNA-binding transcriptional LysR family regulator